jgi:hypothetical protein
VSWSGTVTGQIHATNDLCVTGTDEVGDGSADAVRADHDIRSISVSGWIHGGVKAGRNIDVISAGSIDGNITAVSGNITMVQVTGSIGNTGTKVSAGGSIDTVSAATIVSAIEAGGSIRVINATQSITGNVQSGGDFGTLTVGSGKFLDVANMEGNINVGGNLGGSFDVSGISVNRDLTGAITVSGTMTGSVFAGRDISGSISSGGAVASITAGRELSGVVSAYSNISSVSAVSISGNITAGGNIGAISATKDLTGTVSAGGTLDHASAGRDWTGASISAGRTYALTAGRDLRSNITVSGDIGIVSNGVPCGIKAGRELIGSITSTSGSITIVSAGSVWWRGFEECGDLQASITAYGDISDIESVGSPLAGGTISTSTFTSQHGDIGTVSADRSLDATITAYHDVGDVSAGGVSRWMDPIDSHMAGTLNASITSTTGSIASVLAKGSIQAAFSAGAEIGPVVGWSVHGSITAGTGIGGVRAVRGDIAADLRAQGGNISSVTAATNIGGSVRASQGVGPITLGKRGGGNLTASVTADTGDIDQIVAYGSSPVVFDAIPDVNFDLSLTGGANVDVWLRKDLAWTPPTVPQKINLGSGGDVTGTIHAGGKFSGIRAAGKISGNIEAASVGVGLGRTIWAGKDVTGSVTVTPASGQTGGELSISAWGKVSGKITVPGGITVSVMDGVNGGLIANLGTISVTCAAAVSGEITARDNVTVNAIQQISSNTISTAGAASETSGGEIGGIMRSAVDFVLFANDVKVTSVTAPKASVFGTGKIESGVWRIDSTLSLFSLGKVDLGSGIDVPNIVIVARGDVVGTAKASSSLKVLAYGNVSGQYEGSQFLSIAAFNVSGTIKANNGVADAVNTISGSITTDGSQAQMSVHAGGNITASVTSDNGVVDVIVVDVMSSADVTGNVSGKYGVDVTAYGKVEGNITSELGAVGIQAHGNVSGAISGFDSIDLHAWGNMTGSLSTPTDGGGDPATLENAGGYICAFVAGDLDASVTAGGDIDLDVWGQVRQDVSAGVAGSIAANASNVQITTNGGIGSINTTATGSVQISSLADVQTQNITATLGSVDVEADGTLGGGEGGTITAADDITLLAQDIGRITATTSGGKISATSLASMTITATAAGSIDLLSKDAMDALATVTVPVDPANVYGGLGTAVNIASTEGQAIRQRRRGA